MTTYHHMVWDYEGFTQEEWNGRYVDYPTLVIQHGLKAEVMAYIEGRYGKPFGPCDSKKIREEDCVLSAGGMSWMGWSRDRKWKPFADIAHVEVASHEFLESRLRWSINHADEVGHPHWVMISVFTRRVVFKRATAERLLQHIEDNRTELDAWAAEYNEAFNAGIDKVNESPHVIIPMRGKGPTVLTQGPSGEH